MKNKPNLQINLFLSSWKHCMGELWIYVQRCLYHRFQQAYGICSSNWNIEIRAFIEFQFSLLLFKTNFQFLEHHNLSNSDPLLNLFSAYFDLKSVFSTCIEYSKFDIPISFLKTLKTCFISKYSFFFLRHLKYFQRLHFLNLFILWIACFRRKKVHLLSFHSKISYTTVMKSFPQEHSTIYAKFIRIKITLSNALLI